MDIIAITGASGFLGRRLVQWLAPRPETEIRVLVRRDSQPPSWIDRNIALIEGDIADQSALAKLLYPGCTSVHLAFDPKASMRENIEATNALSQACKTARIKRLIHCSTTAVVGRAPDDRITESTRPRPATEYGITKLKIEDAIINATRDNYEVAILRPTAVFGPGGESLKELADNLATHGRLRNYLKSSLLGRRPMNLVCIDNVVAAIEFLINYGQKLRGEIFIVSDDDSPGNNFVDVERFLMKALGIPDYAVPRLPLPRILLRAMLRLLRRNNVNPDSRYDGARLRSLGFVPPVSFETALSEYAAWYRRTSMHMREGIAR